MSHNEKPVNLEECFKHNQLFHAHRNILSLSNSKCYLDSTLEGEVNNLLEINNKNIERIIYFSLSLKSRLRQSLFNDIFKTINEIDNEIKTGNLDNEIKNKLEKKRKEIINIFSNEINEIEKMINEHTHSLSIEINKLKNKFLTNKVIPFIYNKENDVKICSEEIIILESASETTKNELDIIRDSEDILHKRNFFDLFKNKIPQQQQIEDLNIETQEKNVLSSLVKILSNLFSTLDSGFSYSKVVETRHQLTSLYLSQIKSLHQLKAKQQKILLNMKHHYNIMDIDYFLHILIKQLTFLSESWREIALKISTLENNSLLNEEIIIPIFSFLDDFSLYYESADKINIYQ
ncbi:alpha-xenorhabdolysin family binary toxin subunit B [Proteus sp. PR00224]|uniref:alpha-xenorhabdolysin family binary toxin subunit B n=1 Tax=Proteus sp. PR00224 TaxID=2794026 RepID=UPI0018E44B38|nr:alpha-xenorhabdolysin family binary toxin subunit B [Proteus sp. PR00224]MBI6337837.1 alpha-xenorhabdolysin family binary toxin subunit B [Proteus sp. PR00224]